MLAPSTAVTGPQNFQSIVKPLAVRPKLVFCLISRGVLVFSLIVFQVLHQHGQLRTETWEMEAEVAAGAEALAWRAQAEHPSLTVGELRNKRAAVKNSMRIWERSFERMHGWRPGPADKREDPDYTRLKRALRRVEAALRLVRGVHDDGAGRQAALRDFALQSQRTASSARGKRWHGGHADAYRAHHASRYRRSDFEEPTPRRHSSQHRNPAEEHNEAEADVGVGGDVEAADSAVEERTEATEEETEATGAKEAVGAVEDAVEEAQDARDQLVMIAGVQVPAARQADAAEAAGGSKAEDGCEPRDAETAEDSEMGELARWARSEEAKEEEEWRGQRQQHRIEEDMQAARPRLQQRSHAHRHGGEQCEDDDDEDSLVGEVVLQVEAGDMDIRSVTECTQGPQSPIGMRGDAIAVQDNKLGTSFSDLAGSSSSPPPRVGSAGTEGLGSKQGEAVVALPTAAAASSGAAGSDPSDQQQQQQQRPHDRPTAQPRQRIMRRERSVVRRLFLSPIAALFRPVAETMRTAKPSRTTRHDSRVARRIGFRV